MGTIKRMNVGTLLETDQGEVRTNLFDDFVAAAKYLFTELTDEERMEVLSDYCRFCGQDETGGNRCYCMRDD